MKKMLPLVVLIILLIGGLIIFSQKHKGVSTSNSGKIQATASFYPLYYFTSRIGGDNVDVKNITPAAAEPHDYEPTSQDIARIEKSQLLVLNGGVEAWGAKIKSNLQGTNVVIVTAGEGLLTRSLTEEGKTQTDPHVWLEMDLAKKEVEKIAQGLEKVDPTNTSYYEANKTSLDNDLSQLDNEYKLGLQSCQQKNIITSHAAFGYLGVRYGLTQVPIAGLSPDAEPSAQQLADVAKFAKEHSVKYIFFESLISPKLSETIATEIGAKTLVLDPLEGISDDDIKKGADFLTIMRQNLANLQIALECSK